MLWVWLSPYVADAVGWLRFSAPRLFAAWLGRQLAALGRWLPGALWRLVCCTVTGAWWLVSTVARYVSAYPDYAAVIAEAKSLGKPRRVKILREAWRRAIVRRLIGVTVAVLVLWLMISAVIANYGQKAVWALAISTVAAVAGMGRITRPAPAREADPDDPAEPDPNAPYPLADAHTRAEVAECVRRAVVHEGLTLRLVEEAQRQPWGWHVPVVLATGTPAGLVARLGELETVLDLPSGGVLATPDRMRRARVVLRLLQRDPFASMPAVPDRKPGSLSIVDSHIVGWRLDGRPLTLRLAGAHAVIIGSSGAGKSMTVRAIADVVTACGDALCWDLSPIGVGLDIYGRTIARRERTPAGIERALTTAIGYALARPHVAVRRGMGAEWQPSPDGPALVLVIDEYPKLSVRGKELAAALLDVGRKARVSLVLAASEATKDVLGRAIADSTAIRIMLPSRHADVPLVFGTGMIAEGWHPHRLHPAIDEHTAEDAGRCYVNAESIREPILCKIAPISTEQAYQRAQVRVLMGMPRIDQDTLVEADNQQQLTGTADTEPQGQRRADQVDRDAVADVLTAFGQDHRLWTDEVLQRLHILHPQYRDWVAEDLAASLRPLGISPTGVKKSGSNRNGYYRHRIRTALTEYDTRHSGREIL